MDLEHALSKLPDGVFITESGVYQVVSGQVYKLGPVDGDVTAQLGTGDDDPK